MAWVTAEEMRTLESSAFSVGIDPGELMDLAGAGIARRLIDYFPAPGRACAFIGKGNNGGDAVVALEHLRARGWEVSLRASHPEIEWSTLTRQRVRRAGLRPIEFVPDGNGRLLLLDGLLGIGGRGTLREPLLGLAREMASLRQAGACIASMDLPSGLDPDDGESDATTVTADITLTIGVPKMGLHSDMAADRIGQLIAIPLPALPPPDGRSPRWSSPDLFPDLLPPRSHSFHKGNAGRVAILAGSPGMSGAAELCSSGALRGGAGLVTLFLDPGNDARPPSEIMTHRVGSRIEAFFESKASARIMGPGLGKLTAPQRDILFHHLADDSTPIIIDADALNLLAEHQMTHLLSGHHLITPHPGEFARLAPDLSRLPRLEAARAFVARHPCTLLLKGARTVIAGPGGDLRINPTGHAGMASGGQGDVLAGVCGAMAASGTSLADAAMLAAWVCGRAAERAVTHGGQSHESCTASDTLHHLGGAFQDWKERRR